ncbi:MAG TPA: hypothetical protein VFE46_07195 [Pirellulales bacterium]|jgi:hypothetical protein|nr:hypothetical protein [Pirellulales bacterium]
MKAHYNKRVAQFWKEILKIVAARETTIAALGYMHKTGDGGEKGRARPQSTTWHAMPHLMNTF